MLRVTKDDSHTGTGLSGGFGSRAMGDSVSTFDGKLRQQVHDLMVYVHQVTPELAAYWVAKMDEKELNRRLDMYAKVLSE